MSEKLNPVDFTDTKRQKLIEVNDRFLSARSTLDDRFAKFSDRVSQEIAVEKDVQAKLTDMSASLQQDNIETLKAEMATLQVSIQQKVDDLKRSVLETNRLAAEVNGAYEEALADLQEVDAQMAAIGATIADITAFLDQYREGSPSA